MTGLLPDRIFHNMLSDYEKEQDDLNKIIEIDKADLERIIGARQNVEHFLTLAKKYSTITELTPTIINEFIDKIVVHEATGLGAERNMRVDIYLNYIGQFIVPEEALMTEEKRIIAEKKADKLRRKRESNRRYMEKAPGT